MIEDNSKMPGPRAPAFLRLAAVALGGAAILSPAASAQAQVYGQQGQSPPGLPPAAIRPVPDQLQLAKLVWSTMAAVDHANRSGNYSVLRDISSTGFQINNDPSKLAQIFASIRNSRIDLANALLVPPSYSVAPQQIQADVFRVQGAFKLRPIGITFDMYFQWDRGEWRLFGIDLRPVPMTESIDTEPRP
ncbi:MAG: hypothetical protein H6R45_187 [Proteobacteria bacterium]|nr:hypothetical protein [Pseudomonadota bacterium]